VEAKKQKLSHVLMLNTQSSQVSHLHLLFLQQPESLSHIDLSREQSLSSLVIVRKGLSQLTGVRTRAQTQRLSS
jgi:hypothetical protein